MEILFFRFSKRIAGISTRYLQEVIHSPDAIPFLPVSENIPEMIVHRGRIIAVLDVEHLFSVHIGEDDHDIILLKCEDIECGLKVTKMLQVRTVSEARIAPPVKTYIPEEFLECACRVKNISIPVLSPEKILHHPSVEPAWFAEKSGSH